MNNLAHKLQNIDIRVLQLGLLVVMVSALFRPVGLPIPITRNVRSAYETIDSLPAESIVVFACSSNPATMAEHSAMTKAMLQHFVAKDVRLVIFPSGPQAPPIVSQWAEYVQDLGYKKGTDFITLPFHAGEEKHYAAIADGFKSTYAEQPSSPLWDDITDISDIDLWLDITGGSCVQWAMAHIGGPKHIPIIAGVNTNQVVTLEQYFASNQLAGLIGGLGGGAQYEHLGGMLGEGAAGMDGQALGYMWMILLIVLGNVGYLCSKKAKPAAGGVQQ